MRMNKILKSKRGFTLIELLVVIAIIGLLATVIFASLGLARDRASDAAVKSAINEARKQAEVFFSANGDRYSASVNDTVTNVCNASASATGTTGIYQMLKNAADSAGISVTNIQTCAQGNIQSSCAGGPGKITCHACPSTATGGCAANLDAWAAEVPLKSGGFWCVDSSGFVGHNDTTKLGNGDALCS